MTHEQHSMTLMKYYYLDLLERYSNKMREFLKKLKLNEHFNIV